MTKEKQAMRELRKAKVALKSPPKKEKNWAARLKIDVAAWLKAERAAMRAKAKQRKLQARQFKTPATKNVQSRFKQANVTMKTDAERAKENIDRWK